MSDLIFDRELTISSTTCLSLTTLLNGHSMRAEGRLDVAPETLAASLTLAVSDVGV
jgi:hypothetical protein